MKKSTKAAIRALSDALAAAPIEDVVELMWPSWLALEVWDDMERRHRRAYAAAKAEREAQVQRAKQRRKEKRLQERRKQEAASP
jgi:hypothetical protein